MTDSSCPTTAEQLLLTGANGVCGGAGVDGADVSYATLAVEGALAVAFAFALARRKGLSRGRVALLFLGAAAAAAPGARAVLIERADAPLHAASAAATVTDFVSKLTIFAQAHDGCLEAVRDDCVACQPILRFVLPIRTPCAHRTGRIDLKADALTQGCVVEGDALECGRAHP